MGQPSALYSPLPPPTVVREAPDNWQWWLAYGKHVCELSPFASPASAVGIITENVYVRTFHLCIIEPWHPLVYCHPSLPLLLPPSPPTSSFPCSGRCAGDGGWRPNHSCAAEGGQEQVVLTETPGLAHVCMSCDHHMHVM